MSLVSQLQDFATRVATENKSIRTLVNGNNPNNNALTTTAKGNLVLAINELDAAVDALSSGGSATTLDDLTDVVITAAAVGDILRHNGTSWVDVDGATIFQPLDSDLTAISALSTASYGRAFLALADQTALMALLAAASTTVSGKTRLGTTAETTTGTDATIAVTPSGLHNMTSLAGAAWFVDEDNMVSNTDLKVPSQQSVKAYVDASVVGLFDFKGSTDASANPNYPAASKGDSYVVSVAGKIGGASGKSVDVGDVYMATADNAGGNEATVGTSWTVLEHNLVGALLSANNLSDVSNTTTARSNLGLAIGTNVQAYDADLNAIAALTSAADKLPYSTGTGTWAMADFTSAARTLLDDTTVGAMLTTLGAQPVDSDLTAIAALTSAADKMPYATGAGTWALTDLTATARSILDDTSVSAVRTTISVYSQTEVGDPTTDFVATFNAGLL